MKHARTASFAIFQTQMFLIWLFLTRKSDYYTTIIDLVNQDTLKLHNATFTMFYIIISLSYKVEDTKLPSDISPPLILAFAIIFHITVLTCYMYYSIGIGVRHFLVVKQRTYISEDYTDKEIQRRIRVITASISCIIVIIRTLLGEYPQFYYDLTLIEGKDRTGMPVIMLTKEMIWIMRNFRDTN